MTKRRGVVAIVVLLAAGCSGAKDAATVLADAQKAMGNPSSIQYAGTGEIHDHRLGYRLQHVPLVMQVLRCLLEIVLCSSHGKRNRRLTTSGRKFVSPISGFPEGTSRETGVHASSFIKPIPERQG